MVDTTSVTIAFPNWFYAVCTLGMAGVLLYLGGLHREIKKVCNEHPKIKSCLTRISEILLQHNLAKEYIFTHSPIRLTPKGKEVVQQAGFTEFYEANVNQVMDYVKKQNVKTMADLEEASKEIMLSMEDTAPKFELLKTFAYNNGEPISKLLFACAIELRDILAEKLELTAKAG